MPTCISVRFKARCRPSLSLFYYHSIAGSFFYLDWDIIFYILHYRMVRKRTAKSTTSSQSLTTNTRSSSPASHGRSSSFSKTSSKLTSFFSPTRSARSTKPVSPTLSVPSIRVSLLDAEFDNPRPSSAPDYSRNWQRKQKKMPNSARSEIKVIGM